MKDGMYAVYNDVHITYIKDGLCMQHIARKLSFGMRINMSQLVTLRLLFCSVDKFMTNVLVFNC